ncbi:MAG: O-antigen polymerase, partial [Dehalococcoidia bacterium]
IARILLLSGLLLGVRRVLSDAARGAGYPTLGSIAEIVAWLALLPALGILGPLLGLEGIALALVAAAAVSLGAAIILLQSGRKEIPQISAASLAEWSVRYHLVWTKMYQRGVKRKAISALIVSIVAVITGLVVAMLSVRMTVEIDALIAITTISVAAAPIAKRAVARSLDLLEPIVSGALTLAILFGIRPLSMMLTENGAVYYGHDVGQYFRTTIVMGLIGTLAFVLGYELAFKKSKVTPTSEMVSESNYRSTASAVVVVMSAVAVFLFTLHLSISGSIVQTLRLMAAGRSLELVDATAGTSAYLSVSPLLTSCAAIVIIATRPKLKIGDIIKIVTLIAFPVAMFSLLGNRRFIIPSVAIPLAVYYLRHGRRPSRKTVMLVAPVILILLAAIPYARASGAREQAGGALPILQDFLTSPLDAWKQFITGPDTEMISMLAVEVEILKNPEDFYFGGAVFGDLLLAPIPSAVFPWKPESARDQMLIDAFGLPCRTVAGGLCPDSSVIGTFYQDLWYFGMILGMTSLGAWSAWIWTRVKADRGFVTVVTASCWIVFLPIIIRAGFMPAFSWFLYFLIPSLVGVAASTKIGTTQRSSRRRTIIHAGKARAI